MIKKVICVWVCCLKYTKQEEAKKKKVKIIISPFSHMHMWNYAVYVKYDAFSEGSPSFMWLANSFRQSVDGITFGS